MTRLYSTPSFETLAIIKKMKQYTETYKYETWPCITLYAC